MPEQPSLAVSAIKAVAVPLVTWVLGLISEYRGSRRLDYARGRIELYERLASSTQDDSLRNELLSAKEKEIKAIADSLTRRARSLSPEPGPDGIARHLPSSPVSTAVPLFAAESGPPRRLLPCPSMGSSAGGFQLEGWYIETK